ncbi:plasminogen receptor (KT)-like isoform X2 [Sitophilus oryzae]|uniref:Plasminogen receptor (KT)-like isoform X2 n=1 Tax=Sitophilus oryzae TaxID=7048 RepID=A0A6J2Y079_SITOR|nr:plasminogen receptor (KT)-like isoform X2 [Sitophilus oryzae]
MGNNFTINMEENFKKNQDFITEINNIKIERQLQMRNQMRERQVALEIARQRELFYWMSAFYFTSVIGSVYRLKKKLSLLAPLVPLTFLYAYQADLAYGNKLHRILIEAEHIMQFEEDLLSLPLGVPTASSIDLKRMQNDEQKKLRPHLPPL